MNVLIISIGEMMRSYSSDCIVIPSQNRALSTILLNVEKTEYDRYAILTSNYCASPSSLHFASESTVISIFDDNGVQRTLPCISFKDKNVLRALVDIEKYIFDNADYYETIITKPIDLSFVLEFYLEYVDLGDTVKMNAFCVPHACVKKIEKNKLFIADRFADVHGFDDQYDIHLIG